KISNILHTEKTPYQELSVIDTVEWGRMLLLDGVVMTTEKDEFVYHEMISHVALNTHPNPQKVLVIGGGDGGTIRECVKHAQVEKAVLCEIDERVIWASKEYFPGIAAALFGHPKVEIRVGDGIKFVQECNAEFDVIIIDSTDPVGPGVGLFQPEFYQNVHKALKPEGIMVAQTESPFVNAGLIRRLFRDISGIFPVTKLYLATVPTYPTGLWSFTLGSKVYDPTDVAVSRIPEPDTKYYSSLVHRNAFVLPKFVQAILEPR
ncbi:MAG: polyamine aminopropyltransferase, partial [Heliobacteriaceae bacterium]|nr:polyamine aminopropyltransferase [Heliobacteriaceae bacterium]